MPQAPTSNSALAYLLGPNRSRHLVLTRNYGAVIAVILDDGVPSQDGSILRIPSKNAAEFLEPFSSDIFAPGVSTQYDAIQLYLTANNLALLGPLSSARAALALKTNPAISPAEAVELAAKECLLLTQQQAQRLNMIESALATG